MHCYTLQAGNEEEEDTIIIARSISHAAEIFTTYWVAKHGIMPNAFKVVRIYLRQLPARVDLRALMCGPASGVVTFSQEEGHRLIPM